MLAASLLLFLLFELLPGDVALAELGPYSTPEQRQLWLVANGYDQPIVRALLHLARAFHHRPVGPVAPVP